MSRRKVKGCVFVVMAIAVLGIARAQTEGKIQYRLNLQKGQKYYVKTVTLQQISQTVMGQEQNIEQTIGMGTDYDVNEVDEFGNALVNYIYRWAMFEQKGPMGEMVYDSSKKDVNVPPGAQSIAVLLNEGFSLKITPAGEVLQVKGLDVMRGNIEKKLPEGPMRDFMMKSLDQYLNEEALKEQMEAHTAMYSDKAVGIGDSWNKAVVLRHGLGMVVDNKWTLLGRENGVATIEVVSDIKANPGAKPVEMGDMKMSYELSGKQQGLISMQESTGQVLHSRIEQQISGQVKMAGSGEQGQEMSIPIKIKSIITMETSERGKEQIK